MKILVIGSGGREHAICTTFAKSRYSPTLFCANGNAGIADVAECVNIHPDDVAGLADFAETQGIGLTFVGGETPLALGIVDEFERRGLRIIGVSGKAARLEASKSFAKDFMARHGIPTAAYRTATSAVDAAALLHSAAFGGVEAAVVVKADGLAAGKGVVVAGNRAEALQAIGALERIAGKDAAATIVLEECLFGREVSLIMFADGDHFSLMPPTRDHKRIGEGDTGPNTGGMGTITDSSLLSTEQIDTIIESIIKPTLRGCRDEGYPFRGILFLGLMMTERGPQVLEYNVRFGDPETQAILVRLKTDLVDICDAMLSGNLGETEVEWQPGSSACVVLAATGYPSNPRTGDVITGIDAAKDLEAVSVFHAGTKRLASGELVTAGGRVLSLTALGSHLEEALDRAYAAVGRISWDGMQYRRDIGK